MTWATAPGRRATSSSRETLVYASADGYVARVTAFMSTPEPGSPSPVTDPDEGRRRREAIDLAGELIRIDSTNGNETAVAEVLAAYLTANGIDTELVARDPARANLLARIPGTSGGPSLAFVGHSDVVPADARDWTHPPFAGVIDDEGVLWGRGAVDMKNEVAARAAAMASLARSGWRGAGDLLLVVVADEEDGAAEVGMNWLVHERPDIATDFALNEGGGITFTLSDGRRMAEISVGEKGTCPIRVEAIGEAGHASTPTLGDNAVPLLGQLLARLGQGVAEPVDHPAVRTMLETLLGSGAVDHLGLAEAIRRASALHPTLVASLPAVAGTTMAPTMLHGSTARNVLPARAAVELDCRILPGTTEAEVLAAVRRRLGDDITYELTLAEPAVHGNASLAEGALWDVVSAFVANRLDAQMFPSLCSGFTDSIYLRREFSTVAYGFSPFSTTPTEVIEAGYHNRNERIHIDDIALSSDFHVYAARALLGE